MKVRFPPFTVISSWNVERPETFRVSAFKFAVLIPEVTVTTPADAEVTERPEPKLIVPAVPTRLSLSSMMTSVPPPPPPLEMRVAVIPVILPSATVICGDTVEPP